MRMQNRMHIIVSKNRWALLVLLFTAALTTGWSQQRGRITINGDIYEYLLDDCGDTIILATMGDMSISSLRSFANPDDMNKYRRYRRYAYQVYPYAVAAIQAYRELQDSTADLRRGKKRRYAKGMQKDLKEEFETPLKNLSKTQGMVLFKMIERELNVPVYYVIKDLRGSFTATYWSTIGSFYGHKLREGYERGNDPILDIVLDDINLSYGDQEGPIETGIKLPKKKRKKSDSDPAEEQ